MSLARFIMRNLVRGVITTLVLLLVLGGTDALSPVEADGLTAIQSLVGKRANVHSSTEVADVEPIYEPFFVGIVDGEFVRADENGARVASVTGTGVAELDTAVEQLIVEVTGTGDDALRRAYDYIRAVPYQTMSPVPEQEWPNWNEWAPGIALQLFELGEANCYRYAAAMTYVAIALGYDARVQVGYASHNLVVHAWCEVTLPDGDIRIIDCSLGNDHAYPDFDWCMVTYEDAGVLYFDENLDQYE